MNTLKEVTDAVTAGHTVCWKQDHYQVIRGDVVCTTNGDACGLYWRDGVTSDYDPADFYILEDAS